MSSTGLRSLQIAGLEGFKALPLVHLPFLRSLRFRFTFWKLEDIASWNFSWDRLRDFLRRHEGAGLQTVLCIAPVYWDFRNNLASHSIQVPIDIERRKAEIADTIMEKCGQDSTVSVQFERWENASTG